MGTKLGFIIQMKGGLYFKMNILPSYSKIEIGYGVHNSCSHFRGVLVSEVLMIAVLIS